MSLHLENGRRCNGSRNRALPAVTMKIRALMVDGGVKEYVLGVSHEVTDRMFVVRRVFRVNDGFRKIPDRDGSGSAADGCW